jgi:hypothetical protein
MAEANDEADGVNKPIARKPFNKYLLAVVLMAASLVMYASVFSVMGR